MLQNKKIEINLKSLKTEINKDYWPKLYKLLQTATSLPVGSASCERSFSTMRRVKTWLRITILQERFSNVVLLNIENEMIKTKVTAQQVLNIFFRKTPQIKACIKLPYMYTWYALAFNKSQFFCYYSFCF